MDSNKLSTAILGLVQLVSRLRAPGGCPWDAEQSDSDIKIYLLEEAYEVVDAVEKALPAEICEELGDLLFQIIFLAGLAEDRGEFDLNTVVDNITKKMIHRHPHVFGDRKINSAEDVARNWSEIKKVEKGATEDASSALRSVPSSLPALLRAHRLSERASKCDFDWAGTFEIWEKVLEELKELEETIVDQDNDRFEEEMGDLLFSLVNLSRHRGTNAEHILRQATQKFLHRFEEMERELRSKGIPLEEASDEQMDNAWEKIKLS